MQNLIVYLLAFLVIALVSGNNLPACTGSLINSNIVSKRKGILLTILGYSLGLIAEGNLLSTGLLSLMPVNNYLLSSIVLFTALIVFLFAHKTKVPQSLSMTMAMAILGLDIAIGANPDLTFVAIMVLAWILSSAFAILLSYATMRYSYNMMKEKNIWTSIKYMKLLLIVVSFFTAFTLGANTIGFVYALMPHQGNAAYVLALAIIGIIIGSVFLSRRELALMGNGIVAMRYLNSTISQAVSAIFVEIATIFSIPLSNTQIYVSSIYGSTISYKMHFAQGKTMIAIIRSWIFLAILAMVLGYAFTLLI